MVGRQTVPLFAPIWQLRDFHFERGKCCLVPKSEIRNTEIPLRRLWIYAKGL